MHRESTFAGSMSKLTLAALPVLGPHKNGILSTTCSISFPPRTR